MNQIKRFFSALLCCALCLCLVATPKSKAFVVADDAAIIAALMLTSAGLGISYYYNGTDAGKSASQAIADSMQTQLDKAVTTLGNYTTWFTESVRTAFLTTGNLVISWDGWQWIKDFFSDWQADLTRATASIQIISVTPYATYDLAKQYGTLVSTESKGTASITLPDLNGVFWDSAGNAVDLSISNASRSLQWDLSGSYYSFKGTYTFLYFKYTETATINGVQCYKGTINDTSYSYFAMTGDSSVYATRAANVWDTLGPYYLACDGRTLPLGNSDIVINGYDDFVTQSDAVLGLQTDAASAAVYAPDLLPAWSTSGTIDANDVIDGVATGALASDNVIVGTVSDSGVLTDAKTGTAVGTVTAEGVDTDVKTGEQVTTGDITIGDVAISAEQGQSLGALAITVFPFSIPWDFTRAVKLLVAPAEAPHFKFDPLAPIAGRVGGWNGSTEIDLDFSEFEALGGLSRWVTTIGFCLLLISGTKKLIWTS